MRRAARVVVLTLYCLLAALVWCVVVLFVVAAFYLATVKDGAP